MESSYNVKSKNAVLGAVAAIYVVNTVGTWLAAGSEMAFGLVTILSAVALTVAVFIWCHIDASQQGISLGPGFKLFVILLWPAALIYYLFKSRGIRNGIIALLKAIGFLVVIVIAISLVGSALALIDDRLGWFRV